MNELVFCSLRPRPCECAGRTMETQHFTIRGVISEPHAHSTHPSSRLRPQSCYRLRSRRSALTGLRSGACAAAA